MTYIENDDIQKAKQLKHKYNTLLVVMVGLAEFLLLGLIITVTVHLFIGADLDITKGLFKVIGIDLILLWIGVLIGYYTWVIYFYNINLGLTHEDWAVIKMRQAAGEEVEVPNENPNKGNTLGLPEGTVRGTLALTLIVGALAMLIASFGIENNLPLNQLFIDTFDFFKTAFLMMVAFYFGNKSLQYLNYNASSVKGADVSSTNRKPDNGYNHQPNYEQGNEAHDGAFSPPSFLPPSLVPTKNPDAAAIKSVLNQSSEGPDDISRGDVVEDKSAFDQPNAQG